jgi:predicted transposase YbfD/YdcC
MVSAFVGATRLVLGQQACEAKSNEITAIPLLLEKLNLTGALASIDAMGCQTKVAQAIIGKIERITERKADGTTSRQTSYYILSVRLSAEHFAKAVRSHWSIENNLHWVMDVVFHDDLCRLRTGNGPQNMALIRHAAQNMIQAVKSKASLKVRRKRAAWSTDFPK